MRRQMALAAALIGLALAPTMGRAHISFELAPGGAPNSNLFYTETGANSADGSLGSGGPTVVEITTNADLNVNNGQATIEAATSTLFSDVQINPVTGYILVGFEANPAVQTGGGPPTTGYFYLTASDGTTTFDSRDTNGGNAYVLGTGENFFTVSATNGQTITQVNIISSANLSGAASDITADDRLIQRISQLRVEEGLSITAVPEPATLVTAAMGIVLAGAGGLRHRLRSRKVTV